MRCSLNGSPITAVLALSFYPLAFIMASALLQSALIGRPVSAKAAHFQRNTVRHLTVYARKRPDFTWYPFAKTSPHLDGSTPGDMGSVMMSRLLLARRNSPPVQSDLTNAPLCAAALTHSDSQRTVKPSSGSRKASSQMAGEVDLSKHKSVS